MEKDEVAEIKKFDDPGLVLIGFKPMSKLKVHHHIRPAVFIYPEEDQVSGQFVKDKGKLKPCFLTVCDEIQWLRLEFRQLPLPLYC